MHRVVDISLNGHQEPFSMHEDAYTALARYLERARSRLAGDPDREDVVADLELSIGEKLTSRRSVNERVIDIADVEAVLEEVGAVDADTDAPVLASSAGAHGRRRLYRIKEGQQLAGVCQGLAAYSDVKVEWVRSIFVLLAIFTAGGFLLVYLAAMFILPVVDTHAEYLAAIEEREAPQVMESDRRARHVP
jgi:phage shock protein C